MPQPPAGEGGHHQPEREEDDRAAGVGFGKDQPCGQRGERERRGEDAPLAEPAAKVGQKFAQTDDRHHLADLGNLDVEGADIDPAARALIDIAHEQHQKQQEDSE